MQAKSAEKNRPPWLLRATVSDKVHALEDIHNQYLKTYREDEADDALDTDPLEVGEPEGDEALCCELLLEPVDELDSDAVLTAVGLFEGEEALEIGASDIVVEGTGALL